MWSDKIATKTIVDLKKLFNIKTFVETGTWKGVNSELYSNYFHEVLTCEVDKNIFKNTSERLNKYKNIKVFNCESSIFLDNFKKKYIDENRKDIIFFYLDAHFYKQGCTSENRWVVRDELNILKDFRNCIICIHDFDCSGLGHLCYDGEHLDWNVVKDSIKKINSDFFYYINSREFCDIVDLDTVKELPIEYNDSLVDYVRFINSSDQKRYRGILYAIPKELDLKMFNLLQLKDE